MVGQVSCRVSGNIYELVQLREAGILLTLLRARGCCLILPHSKASSRSYSSSCPDCMKENGVLSFSVVPHPPCVCPLCYEASALGASFLPFLWEGESEVFTVLRGGLCSATSSCSEGSLYMATEGMRRTKTH